MDMCGEMGYRSGEGTRHLWLKGDRRCYAQPTGICGQSELVDVMCYRINPDIPATDSIGKATNRPHVYITKTRRVQLHRVELERKVLDANPIACLVGAYLRNVSCQAQVVVRSGKRL